LNSSANVPLLVLEKESKMASTLLGADAAIVV
jgi:hypothetical protein